MNISVVYSPDARQVREWRLELSVGATVAQAIAACGVLTEFPDLDTKLLTLGIWGRKASRAHVLHDHDRVEIYRGLRVDPKVARRERFNRQGVKRAGLFAKKRAGGKAGY